VEGDELKDADAEPTGPGEPVELEAVEADVAAATHG
jgi:hypothetical protein